MNTRVDLRGFVAEFLRLPVEKVTDDAAISDLVADSFQAVELLVALQDEFPCTLNHEDLTGVDTLGALLGLLQEKLLQHTLDTEQG